VPAVWVVSLLGAGVCLFLMSGLPVQAWIRFVVWLAIGLAFYLAYGFGHSALRRGASPPAAGGHR
jgi:APA family basic amino acid/polyamine antiporter